jgi:hypothetical protein
MIHPGGPAMDQGRRGKAAGREATSQFVVADRHECPFRHVNQVGFEVGQVGEGLGRTPGHGSDRYSDRRCPVRRARRAPN